MSKDTTTKTTTTIERQMVRATQTGFYRAQLVTPGTTFALISPSDFSSKWMVKVDASEPDQLVAAYTTRKRRPGEEPASSAFTPATSTAKAGKSAPTPTGNASVI